MYTMLTRDTHAAAALSLGAAALICSVRGRQLPHRNYLIPFVQAETHEFPSETSFVAVAYRHMTKKPRVCTSEMNIFPSGLFLHGCSYTGLQHNPSLYLALSRGGVHFFPSVVQK